MIVEIRGLKIEGDRQRVSNRVMNRVGSTQTNPSLSFFSVARAVSFSLSFPVVSLTVFVSRSQAKLN